MEEAREGGEIAPEEDEWKADAMAIELLAPVDPAVAVEREWSPPAQNTTLEASDPRPATLLCLGEIDDV